MKWLAKIKDREKRKISKAIIYLSSPLLSDGYSLTQAKDVFTLTILAWNLSLISAEARHLQIKYQVGLISAQLPKVDTVLLTDTLYSLIDKKNELYPAMKMFILSHDVSFQDSKLTLDLDIKSIDDLDTETQFIA